MKAVNSVIAGESEAKKSSSKATKGLFSFLTKKKSKSEGSEVSKENNNTKDKTQTLSKSPSKALEPAVTVLQKVPGSLMFISANHDADQAFSDGHREYVHNLGDEGEESWNKWYSGPNSLQDKSFYPVVITVLLSMPLKIHRYSLKSAYDLPSRNPKSWEVWAKNSEGKYSIFEEIHAVQSENFNGLLEEKIYDITDTDVRDKTFDTIELRIFQSNNPEEGVHLGSISFYTPEFLKSKLINIIDDIFFDNFFNFVFYFLLSKSYKLRHWNFQ